MPGWSTSDNGGVRIVHLAPSVGERSPGVRSPIQEIGLGYRRAGHEFFVVSVGRRYRHEETAFGRVITTATGGRLSKGLGLSRSSNSVKAILEQLAPEHIEVSDPVHAREASEWARTHGTPAVFFGAARPTGTGGSSDRYLESIGPGVDLELFNPLRWSSEVRREYFGDEVALLVRTDARWTRGDIRLHLDALGELRALGIDARLVITGDGPWRMRLEREARDLPVTFLTTGLDRRELAELLATADLSVRRRPKEDDDLSELESLASGTPVVDRDAREIARVLSIPVNVRRQSAREQASDFPWSRTITRLLEVHNALSASDQQTPFDEALS
jgi:alpha-1,6-mannosyltransferase